MAKKISKEFQCHFVDVVHDQLEAWGFQLATEQMAASLIASDSRYRKTKTPKYNFSSGMKGRILYVKAYPNDVFAAIHWDLRPWQGKYICDLTKWICHPPTRFLLSELEDVPFDPFRAINGEEGVIGNGRLNNSSLYDPNLPAEKLRELASELICAIKNEALPWLDQNSNLSSLEQLFDDASYPSFTKVGFYIVIGEMLKARAEMTQVILKKETSLKKFEAEYRTRHPRKSYKELLEEVHRSQMEEIQNKPSAKIAYQNLPCRIRERLSHKWIDDEIIERVNQLTLAAEV
ncbi:MAG: hypothetical protein WC028_24735 [Candidatus Obscuribacterales bacterium]|jgi:hypothetical protein